MFKGLSSIHSINSTIHKHTHSQMSVIIIMSNLLMTINKAIFNRICNLKKKPFEIKMNNGLFIHRWQFECTLISYQIPFAKSAHLEDV